MSEPLRESVLAKIAALKSYVLVVFTDCKETKSEMKQIALDATHQLQKAIDPRKVRQRCFYWLVLSELARNDDPSDFRIEAMDDGERLINCGFDDPFAYYMKIVTATTRKMTTADFGDFRSSCAWSHGGDWWKSVSPSSDIDTSTIWPALAQLDLPQETVMKYDTFLRDASLDQIAISHGITSSQSNKQ